MTAIADITARYIEQAVRSHNAATIAERAEAERTAAHLARQFGIDEMAMETQVLAAVYATYTDAELAEAAASPTTRKYARAEIARRAA
jgi:hypothetical protein